jgi:hypothetical protein
MYVSWHFLSPRVKARLAADGNRLESRPTLLDSKGTCYKHLSPERSGILQRSRLPMGGTKCLL